MSNPLLHPTRTIRAFRDVFRVAGVALRVLPKEDVVAWMTTPCRALDGYTPIQYAVNGQAAIVEELLISVRIGEAFGIGGMKSFIGPSKDDTPTV